MLKAYSIIKNLDKKACEIIRNAGIKLDISNSDKRPDREGLIKLLDEYDILIIGIEDKFTKDMLPITTKKKIIATLSIGLDHIDRAFLENNNIKIINCQTSNVISVAEHIFALILGLKKRIIEANDIITINIPLTEENKNLISKEKIRLMKKTATFINTSRGELVDMTELIKYADENKTFNVGLDIDAENYKDILNIKRNNVIVTPHIAGVTREAVERMDVEVANRLVEYIKK